MGCDVFYCYHSFLVIVSIHAPAWGATSCRKDTYDFRQVSIHAPAWGATSRPALPGTFLYVSIHAPAWGATEDAKYAQGYKVFQSTHPHGVRPFGRGQLMPGLCFNPRTRMGCDGGGGEA